MRGTVVAASLAVLAVSPGAEAQKEPGLFFNEDLSFDLEVRECQISGANVANRKQTHGPADPFAATCLYKTAREDSPAGGVTTCRLDHGGNRELMSGKRNVTVVFDKVVRQFGVGVMISDDTTQRLVFNVVESSFTWASTNIFAANGGMVMQKLCTGDVVRVR